MAIVQVYGYNEETWIVNTDKKEDDLAEPAGLMQMYTQIKTFTPRVKTKNYIITETTCNDFVNSPGHP